jgi:GNAT superfamily N-acetyltransferase
MVLMVYCLTAKDASGFVRKGIFPFLGKTNKKSVEPGHPVDHKDMRSLIPDPILLMNDTIDIKYLADCPETIPTLASWTFEQWGRQYKMESVRVQLELFANRMNRDKIPLALVAFLGAQPVGTASLKVREMTTHTHLPYWLGAVYVVEQFRNQGFGTELILRTSDKARDLNVRTLYLHTPDKAGLYLRLGWEEIERTVYYDREVVILKKELEKPGH